MKRIFEPIVGMASAVVAKAENMHELVSNSAPDFTLKTVLFYIMIGFLGAFGGWVFKAMIKQIHKEVINVGNKRQ